MVNTPGQNDKGHNDDLRQLLAKGQQGDVTALSALRRLLDSNADTWRYGGDLARQAEEALIGLAAGDNLILRESLIRKVTELKAELAPSSPLERLLVERITACWIAVNHADTVFGQSRDLQPGLDGQLRRRQQNANRRFLESMKLLATIRRLLGGKGKAPS